MVCSKEAGKAVELTLLLYFDPPNKTTFNNKDLVRNPLPFRRSIRDIPESLTKLSIKFNHLMNEMAKQLRLVQDQWKEVMDLAS